MGSKIITVLFFVFVLALIIYFFNSGLASQGFRSLVSAIKFSTSTSQNSGGGLFYSNPPTGSGSGNGSGNGSGSGIGSGSGESGTPRPPAVATSEIPLGFTRAQLSPWFHEVRFGGVSSGPYGQITLSTNFYWQDGQDPGGLGLTAASATVDVTGWRITANRGGEYVPQAINLYDPSGLMSPSDIWLRSGDYVNLYSQPGPFNLRLNECIGYIGNQNKTNPQLPSYCPSPISDSERAQIANFTGACQNYLYSIGSCQVPDLNNAQIPQSDYSCINFIENHFSYRDCYDAHVDDAQFLSNAVWVWMGASPVDPYHDNVYLYDRTGLLVDSYKY